MIRSKFSFFKAGQGAFYGGSILSVEDGIEWTIVYDCGTSNFIKGNSQSLNEEIDNFKNGSYYFQTRDTIDLLFISHLDYDHVSGVVRLIKEFKVKRIVMPFFPEEIRQFAALSVAEIDPNAPENTDEDLTFEDYSNFIENPYNYLANLQPETPIEIIVIRPEGENDNILEFGNYDSDDNDLQIVGTALNGEQVGLEGSKIKLYDNNLQFFIKKRWEFTTFVKGISKQQFKKLEKCLNKLLNRGDDIPIGYTDITDLVTNHRAAAHKCYKNNLSDINAHGLVLLHGPINFKSLQAMFYTNDEHCSWPFFYRGKRRLFYPALHQTVLHEEKFYKTLLMGDTSINPGNNQLVFPQRLTTRLAHVHTFQVPHHGSSKNWDLQSYNDLRLGDKIATIPINVCNFGYGNTYGHPSHQVLMDLRGRIILNSQFLKFSNEHFVRYP